MLRKPKTMINTDFSTNNPKIEQALKDFAPTIDFPITDITLWLYDAEVKPYGTFIAVFDCTFKYEWEDGTFEDTIDIDFHFDSEESYNALRGLDRDGNYIGQIYQARERFIKTWLEDILLLVKNKLERFSPILED